MKLADAKEMIRNRSGFRVSFDIRENGLLKSDHVPERYETPFSTEDEAWEFARKLSPIPGVVNIYVIYASTWQPVEGYYSKMLNKHGGRA